MQGWEVWMPSAGPKRQYITQCRSLSVLLFPTAMGTAEPCQALPLVTPGMTRLYLGHTDRHMDRWTAAGLLLTEWDRHVAIKQWWDLNVTWLSGKKKKNP